VAARAEGKKFVSEEWVQDSLDRGVLADADRVIYWPVRDSKAIPGAQSLLIFLTGYQRNYREYVTVQLNQVFVIVGLRIKAPTPPTITPGFYGRVG